MTRTLQEIAEVLGGKVIGNGQIPIVGIHSLDEAEAGQLSFYMDPRYKEKVQSTRASALIVEEKTPYFQGTQVLVSNPGLAYSQVAKLFAPTLADCRGISPDAVIHEEALIGSDVSVFPLVHISRGQLRQWVNEPRRV